MRSFSIEEQRVINRIVNDASRSLQYVLINAYYDIFYNNKVDFNVQEPGHLIFYREIDSVNIDNLLSVQQQIIIQSRLIQYLADNRLIYLIENNSVKEMILKSFYGLNNSETYVEGHKEALKRFLKYFIKQ